MCLSHPEGLRDKHTGKETRRGPWHLWAAFCLLSDLWFRAPGLEAEVRHFYPTAVTTLCSRPSGELYLGQVQRPSQCQAGQTFPGKPRAFGTSGEKRWRGSPA